MEQCNDCWMKEYKDTKGRPIKCASCELNYYTDQLFLPLKDLFIVQLPKRFIDFCTNVIKKITR